MCSSDLLRARGDEVVGHGRTNAERACDFSPHVEAQRIGECVARIAAEEGNPPLGWMSPWVNQSAQTPDLLAEAGLRYTLDWPMDDQPVWMRTDSGPLLSVPYPHEVNDVPTVVLHHATAPSFASAIVDNLDEMLAQSEQQALVCGITIHTFIVGQPFRLRRFRAALEHLLDLPGVWLTTPGEIANHYTALHPPPGATAE